jgi:fatty-acyl-CoA synthase
MFHSWGLLNLLVSLGTGCTVVTARRFHPEAVLDSLARQHCTGLVVVPVMLDRLLSLGPEAIKAHDLSSLRFIASSGSAIGAQRARRTMEVFGDRLYNLYGSTEVAYVTIATPEDLRADYDTVGRPPFGTRVRLFDTEGNETPSGAPGRIFVANGEAFSGYTGGGSKEVIGDFMATGDVGHFDDAGRLFVDGRDDEMIISGGENVFPREVEELLSHHPGVVEAAAVGVSDEEFGQRLCVFVVREPDGDLDEETVKQYVRQNLARYKVPRRVVFVEELPRNPAGKVVKRKLLEQLEERAS